MITQVMQKRQENPIWKSPGGGNLRWQRKTRVIAAKGPSSIRWGQEVRLSGMNVRPGRAGSRNRQFLQPQKLNRQPAEQDTPAGQGMGISLHGFVRDQTHSGPGQKNSRQHGCDRSEPEHGSDQNQTRNTLLGCRVHQQGNQRFAGPQHKDHEQDPRCNVFGRLVMQVRMVMEMRMGMFMRMSLLVRMRMAMGPIADGSTDTPEAINQSKGNQRPARDAAAKALEGLQRTDCPAQGNSQHPQNDRTTDMSQSTQESNPRGFGGRPAPSPSHHCERHIMIRSQQGMNQSQRARRRCQYPDFRIHSMLRFPAKSAKIKRSFAPVNRTQRRPSRTNWPRDRPHIAETG